jgi:hypothetical protein
VNSPRKAIATAAIVATATLGTAMATPTSASAATYNCSTCSNMILNEPNNGFTLPLGVIRDHDGTYANGKYDAVLPSNLFTWQIGWTHAAGFYLAPGYCAGLWRSNNGSNNWDYQGFVEAGPSGTQFFIGLNTSYKVDSQPC